MKIRIMAVLAILGLCFAGCGKSDDLMSGRGAPAPASPPPPTTLDVQGEMGQFFSSVQQDQAAADAAAQVEKNKILLAQAQQALESENFEEAFTLAKSILDVDPNNAEAQKVFEKSQTGETK